MLGASVRWALTARPACNHRSVLVLKKLGDDLLPQLMSSLRVLREEGLRCVVERDVYDRLSLEDGFGFVETFLPGDALAEAVDFCVCLGGDGVILHASTLFGSGPAPPIISFNLGSLGFLTAHNMENFQEDVRALMYGDGPMDGAFSFHFLCLLPSWPMIPRLTLC